MSRRFLQVAGLALTVALTLADDLLAHEIRPAYLEIREVVEGRFEVLWKVPMRGNLRLDLEPVFPEGCTATSPIAGYRAPGAVVERWTMACPFPLVGRALAVRGLEATLTDVLLRLDLIDATAQTARLGPSSPSYTPAARPGRWDVARTYLVLGVEHILGGIDHLLFVLALMLIVGGWGRLLSTITAFTIAHSITLALAALGFVRVPQAPVEAVIALSILFLASEIARGESASLTMRYPWIVAFTFGLLHGFGFAGALSEIGLPETEIPISLLFFNVGVELGQIAFVAVVVALKPLFSRVAVAVPGWARLAPVYGIGSVAAFWAIQRVTGFWS